MAYLIYGEKAPLVYLANYRTASTSTAKAIMDQGGSQLGNHHSPPVMVPDNAVVTHTVRHPCDVLVSYWYKKASGTPFAEFIELVVEGHQPYLQPNSLYTRWGPLPNHIIRYENLQSDWDDLCEKVGLQSGKLVQSNSKRPKSIHWKLLYTPDLFDKVYAAFNEEMERYGYGRN